MPAGADLLGTALASLYDARGAVAREKVSVLDSGRPRLEDLDQGRNHVDALRVQFLFLSARHLQPVALYVVHLEVPYLAESECGICADGEEHIVPLAAPLRNLQDGSELLGVDDLLFGKGPGGSGISHAHDGLLSVRRQA